GSGASQVNKTGGWPGWGGKNSLAQARCPNEAAGFESNAGPQWTGSELCNGVFWGRGFKNRKAGLSPGQSVRTNSNPIHPVRRRSLAPSTKHTQNTAFLHRQCHESTPRIQSHQSPVMGTGSAERGVRNAG